MSDQDSSPFIAYTFPERKPWTIRPATMKRDWMDATPSKFAYHCLPLVMANQAGWIIECPVAFSAVWNGSTETHRSLRIQFDEGATAEEKQSVHSNFGSGIITFAPPFLFRTPEGVGLLARGIPNNPKMNCQPLEGFVETDWSNYSFTMNWKILVPNAEVRFEAGEPICFLQPMRIGLMEELEAETRPMESEPELASEFTQWVKSRTEFALSPDRDRSWHTRSYYKGETFSGEPAPSHRDRLKLSSFSKDSGD